MIKSGTVRDVIDTAKVEEVVGDFVSLRRRGSNLLGLCPFHNEKTPSFNVNPAKNIYKCFGCGRAGDSVNFLMEHEHLSFPEAIRWLARKYGIEIEEVEMSTEQLAEQQLADSLFIANQFACDFYQQSLFETDKGRSIGLSYFKSRGFREETIRKFGLGYAPATGTALLTAARTSGHKEETLEKAGLAKNSRDFFRDRVMFTIHNLSGKVVGFGGRILQKDVKAPKYINTPETEIYNKSKILFGAYFAKQAIRRLDECILTEGYTDVISLHQAGIENVVASSGTSLTVDQIRLIKRYTPNVKLLFDGDKAGIGAALRGVDLLLEQDLNIKIVVLPDGEDPDSYLQKVGLTVFQDYLNDKAEDFIFFKANLLLAEAGNDPVKRSALIRDIIASIALIPEPLKRSLYVKECARLFDVDESLLIAEMNKLLAQQLAKHQQRKAAQQAPPQGDFPDAPPPGWEAHDEGDMPPDMPPPIKEDAIQGDEFQERDLVRLLMLYGSAAFDETTQQSVAQFIIANIDDVIDLFDNALYQRIAKEIQVLVGRGEVPSIHHFIHHESPEFRNLVLNFATTPYEYSENWEKKWDVILNQKMPDDNFRADSTTGLKRFRLRKLGRMIQENTHKIKDMGTSSDEDELLLYMRLHQRLQTLRNDLAKELGTVVL
ncbi:MAG: DNA primase [Saprospiraceae bacterium]